MASPLCRVMVSNRVTAKGSDSNFIDDSPILLHSIKQSLHIKIEAS